MNFKQFFIDITEKTKALWRKGKIQRASRVTYDVVWNIVLFFIIVGAGALIFAGGVGAGYFASLVKDEPIRDYDEMKRDIYNYEQTSKLYFAGEKYIGDVRADLHREEIKLKNISESLKDAVIATEDELFYEHKGVVPKAIVRAIYQEASNSDTKTGGSTLTQQLIKNQILTNEVSFERKAKEILLAMRLENFFDKDEILEAYLNIVPYGRDASGQNIAGIQTAAKGVFGVDAKDLTLPQAAFLAGIPQNPYAFTPFETTGEVKDKEGLKKGINRMNTVLKRMHQAEFITEKEYKKALKHDITKDFTKKSSSPIEKYPSVVFELETRAKEIIRDILVEEDGYTIEEINEDDELREQYEILADRALRMNGYHIHSTINKKMYDTMQKIVKEYPYYGPDRTFVKKGETESTTEQVETGAVLIENKTGKILSFVPGRTDSLEHQYNHATQAYRSPGSTMKPLAVYAPGMELGIIQPGSVIADIPTSYGGYTPNNYGGGHYGLVSAREAMANSYNVSAVKIYTEVLQHNPVEKYLMNMGITRVDKVDKSAFALALGGMSYGVTVEQNTNAFATFSNGGKYVPSYMIEKITDSDGKVIYEHEVEKVKVFSPQTAYLTIDMMREVLRTGTGTYLPGQLAYGGVDWAGKTGTSQDYRDAWFVGTNPNVTMGTWLGYDTPSSIYCPGCSLSYSQRNLNLWAQLMNAMTEIKPELMAPQNNHKQPDGLTYRSYCATSGLAASDLCAKAGLARSDLYNVKYVPSKVDDSLVGGSMPMVKIDGNQVVAGPNTPAEFTTSGSGGFAFNPEFLSRMGYDKLGDLSVLIPRKNAGPWEKIGFKGGGGSSGSAIQGGSSGAPPAPGGLSAASSTISWSGATGHQIVGYRIYRASKEGGSASLIGHTTGTSYSIPSGGGVYHVRAVNYHGQESGASGSFMVNSTKSKGKKNNETKAADKKNDAKPNNEAKREDKASGKKETDKQEDENDEEVEADQTEKQEQENKPDKKEQPKEEPKKEEKPDKPENKPKEEKPKEDKPEKPKEDNKDVDAS